MPTGTRVRANNVFGTTTDNPLTAAAITFNSSELPLLPEVTGDHSVITLDPLRQNGEPEIVVVTAHGPGGSSATITRGQYGTVARQHPQGTIWAHAPLDEDMVVVTTSALRPSDPYEGQLIYETDTFSFIGRINGAWSGLIPAGVTVPYAGTTAPNGWLLADGSAVSRTTYADLFGSIGTAYGVGDGATTFNLPDLRDTIPLGKGTTFSTLGATGGSKDAVVVTHTHTQNAHNHTGSSAATSHQHGVGTLATSGGSHTHTASGFNNWVIERGLVEAQRIPDAGSTTNGVYITFTSTVPSASSTHSHTMSGSTANESAHTHGITVNSNTATNQSSGVSGTNANMPPYQVFNHIIKY